MTSKRPRKASKVKAEASIGNIDINHGCLPTLILDSGGWTVKHGFLPPLPPHPSNPLPSSAAAAVTTSTATTVAATCTTRASTDTITPRLCPNATAKPRHQLTILTADEIHTVRNQSQLEFTRPTERGYCTDLTAQLRVWKRICDLEGVSTAAACGPGRAEELRAVYASTSAGGSKKRKGGAGDDGDAMTSVPAVRCSSSQCRMMMLSQPFTPQSIVEKQEDVAFQDLGFCVVGRVMAQVASSVRYLDEVLQAAAAARASTAKPSPVANDGIGVRDANSHCPPFDDGTRCCLVVDTGFSFTHVVPTVKCQAVTAGIRRINVGGRMITNLLKEWISYRQWNLMDEFSIVNDAKEALCYVVDSDDMYNEKMMRAREIRQGYRDYDREFVLPDFADTFQGSVRLAAGLRKKRDHEEREKERRERRELKKKRKLMEQEKNDKRSEHIPIEEVDKSGEEDSMTVKEDKTQRINKKNGESEEEKDDRDVDSEDETDEQKLKRIQRQKEEERRRRELEEESRQALTLSVERFAAPEMLFHPEDVGLDQVGIAEAIVQSVKACPAQLHASMFANIALTGGNALLPGYSQRIEREVRSLAPSQYKIQVYVPRDPVTYAWEGAKQIVNRAFGETGNTNMCSGSSSIFPLDSFRRCFIDRAEWEANKETVGTASAQSKGAFSLK